MNSPQENPFKVFCRIREVPESSPKDISSISYQSTKSLSITSGSSVLNFEFDHIFFPNSSQEEVFRVSAKPIIDAVLQGINGAILAYGQTSSGKTFTITGPSIFDPVNMGILPRMVSSVFDYIDSTSENLEFTLKASYCELYLEKVYDLVFPTKKHLKLRENKDLGFYVQNLSDHFVSSDLEVFEILRIGTENRHETSTKMNSRSSRSHTLFRMNLLIKNSVDLSHKSSQLTIVDLAGSERVSKTGAEGLRLKELKNINRSINALTSVINALIDNKNSHVPYRDSKLTKLLSEALGGNSKTSMICNCSPLLSNESETISTLRFGNIAKNVKNTPKVNREMTFAELRLRILKIEEEIKKKNAKIKTLEEILGNINTDFKENPTENNEKNEGNLMQSDEFLIELDDANNKLSGLFEENHKLKNELQELILNFENFENSKNESEELIHIYKEKNNKNEEYIKSNLMLIHKLSIEKNVIHENIQKCEAKKIELSRQLMEKSAEAEDLQTKTKIILEKQENSEDPPNNIEQLKAQLLQEQQKFKKNQNELQELQLRYSLALQDQASDTNYQEKEILNREIKARNDKIVELEEELEHFLDGTKMAKMILNEDEKNILELNFELEKKIEEISEMYKILVARQSNGNVEKQINMRKIQKINEKILKIEEKLSEKKESLRKAEEKAGKILDEMASQSIYNRIRVPIKGGGGKGPRSCFSRLTGKPRMFSSVPFE